MPNHVTTRCIAFGPPDDVRRFLLTCFSQEGDAAGPSFDFQKIVPRPAILEDTVEGSGLSEEEQEHRRRAFAETGHASWLSWSRDNWGTKWNAYQTVVEHTNFGRIGLVEFTFQTAWSFPEPIFDKLVELFPMLRFDVASFDEGWMFAIVGEYSRHTREAPAVVPTTNQLYRTVYGDQAFEERLDSVEIEQETPELPLEAPR